MTCSPVDMVVSMFYAGAGFFLIVAGGAAVDVVKGREDAVKHAVWMAYGGLSCLVLAGVVVFLLNGACS